MAVRRSARLRGRSSSAEVQEPTSKPEAPKQLLTIMEREVTPPGEVETHSDVVAARTPRNASVQKTPNTAKTPSASTKKDASAKTPTTTSAIRPPHEEMHPSKVRQSTTKQPDSGLILGFNPVKRDANGNIVKESLVENTPSKAKASPSSQFGTPDFEFKFNCQESQLSDEAKKLMESVREDVARIKSRMVQDKGKQDLQDEEAEKLRGERKMAKPKSKAGRFSDAHMAEFKKMDSIAGHASAFRAVPGRFQPVNKSLKRTNSKARLDEPETPSSPSKSPSKLPTASAATGPKRAKQEATDDTSTRRPSPLEENATTPATPRPKSLIQRSHLTPTKHPEENATKPATPRPKPSIRSSLMTPTKAFRARSSSVRPPKTSMIPSLARSPAPKAVAPPRTPQTEFNPRLKSNLPTLGHLKSILRRHQPLFSNDPAKIAAGTHVAAPNFSSDMLLSTTRDSASEEQSQTPSPKKRVEFTPSVKSRYELAQASPSPSKIPTTLSRPSDDVVYPTLPTLTPEKDSIATKSPATKTKTPSVRQVRPSDASSMTTTVPDLPTVPHGIVNKERRRLSDGKPKSSEASREPAPLPEFPAVPHGILNKQRRRETTDKVRPSQAPSEAKPLPEFPTVPHDIINKKRRREADDEADAENVPPAESTCDGRDSKRMKMSAPSPVKSMPTPSPVKVRAITPARATPGKTPSKTPSRFGTPASARQKNRGVLSLSRLHMLAKPKERR